MRIPAVLKYILPVYYMLGCPVQLFSQQTRKLPTLTSPRLQDINVLKVQAVAPNSPLDSLAGSYVYDAITLALIQTRFFTVLGSVEITLSREEIKKRMEESYVDTDLARDEYNPTPDALLFIYLNNFELYTCGRKKAVHIQGILKIIDVKTHIPIAFQRFNVIRGGSYSKATLPAGSLEKFIQRKHGLFKKWNSLTSDQLQSLSGVDRNLFIEKTGEAAEGSASQFDAWLRNALNQRLNIITYHISGPKRSQFVVIEGGNNIGMKEGMTLTLLAEPKDQENVKEMQTEEIVGAIKVYNVSADASRCKIIRMSKKGYQTAIMNNNIIKAAFN